MIHVERIDSRPIRELHYLNAARRGGTEICRLPILRGVATGLPTGCEAVVLASDLQGISSSRFGPSELLGVALAEFLEELAEDGLIPSIERTGVVLAGDLYSHPAAAKRGGMGDVCSVWRAFAEAFAWTMGVAGNHDDFGGPKGIERLVRQTGAVVLDGEVVDEGGLRFGGVSYVAGHEGRPGRRPAEDQFALIDLVLEAQTHVLVLHEGPCAGDTQAGNAEIRNRLLAAPSPPQLTVCGHVHWDDPLGHLPRGLQVVNVDSRVVLLTA